MTEPAEHLAEARAKLTHAEEVARAATEREVERLQTEQLPTLEEILPEPVEVVEHDLPVPVQSPTLDRKELNALFKLAAQLSETSFAPPAFHSKPWECLAAILTGRELGIGPMESLTQIHVIQGRPTLSAQLMRALVFRRGHSITIEESTPEKCVVVGRRCDTGDEHRVEFTMEDAVKARLVTKDSWKNYPRMMLAARATSALCRELFPDCLAGAAYVPEEME